MSDRISSITIVLERDITDEYADDIIKFVSIIKGVVEAKKNIADPNTFAAESRVRSDLVQKMFEVLYKTEGE